MTRVPQLGRRGAGWVAIQAILFFLAGFAGLFGPAWSGAPRIATSAVGVVVMAGGVVILVLGARHLQRRDALTPLPFPRDNAGLVVTGVYGIVRHPIYSGAIMGAVGSGLLTGSPAALAMAAVLFVFFDLKSRREEAWLERRFPDYAAYRARTPRLIPWLIPLLGGARD